jgi:hypothetical protein
VGDVRHKITLATSLTVDAVPDPAELSREREGISEKVAGRPDDDVTDEIFR